MIRIIKSMFGIMPKQPLEQPLEQLLEQPVGQTLYPLKNHSFESFDVRFKKTTSVITHKGHTTITDNGVHTILDTYKTKDNEPHVLTMIIYTKPGFDANISFDDKKRTIHIETKRNTFEQKEGSRLMIYEKEKKMIDTRKYTYFCVDESI